MKFHTKKITKHFVGLVRSEDGAEAQITFFKRNGNHFQPPNQPDMSFVEFNDIVMKLPEPSSFGGGSRTGTTISFGVDVSSFTNIICYIVCNVHTRGFQNFKSAKCNSVASFMLLQLYIFYCT